MIVQGRGVGRPGFPAFEATYLGERFSKVVVRQQVEVASRPAVNLEVFLAGGIGTPQADGRDATGSDDSSDLAERDSDLDDSWGCAVV